MKGVVLSLTSKMVIFIHWFRLDLYFLFLLLSLIFLRTQVSGNFQIKMYKSLADFFSLEFNFFFVNFMPPWSDDSFSLLYHRGLHLKKLLELTKTLTKKSYSASVFSNYGCHLILRSIRLRNRLLRIDYSKTRSLRLRLRNWNSGIGTDLQARHETETLR